MTEQDVDALVAERLKESSALFDIYGRTITVITWIGFNVIAMLTIWSHPLIKAVKAVPLRVLLFSITAISVGSCLLLIYALWRATWPLLMRIGEGTGNKGYQYFIPAGAIILIVVITYTVVLQAANALSLKLPFGL